MPKTAAPLLHFEFVNESGVIEPLTFREPSQVVVANSVAEVRPALREVERVVASGSYAAGFVTYESAPAFDPALTVRKGGGVPLIWFGIFAEPILEAPLVDSEFCLSCWKPSIGRADFSSAIAALREEIASGNAYQVNYTFRLRAEFKGDDFAFYRRLSKAQRSSYCAYLDTGRFRILSASPELFFRVKGRRIITMPMKGTIGRGRWLEEDESRLATLKASEKERSENIMIVDLLRNDLGRVAQIGSVRVSDLCRAEQYPTVFQMTSKVEADLRPGVTLEEIFGALFPCGSVTGAPKVSAMRLISALENAPRGVYCGSIGFLTPRNEAVFNVAIRTAVIDAQSGAVEYGVGGGITWESSEDGEYHEALTKALVLAAELPQFELLETLKLENGRFALLDRHVGRLADSARFFEFVFPIQTIMRELEAQARTFSVEARRVRLFVSSRGDVRVESAALEGPTRFPLPVAMASAPVSRANVFLYHKTSLRTLFERHRGEHPSAYDVLMWNEEGEVTEFTTGNLVAELDGMCVTPPRESGLLAGTMRAELIENGEIVERRITRNEITRATRCWLVNSVRGRVPVHLGG